MATVEDIERMMDATMGNNIAMRCVLSLMLAEREVTEDAVAAMMHEELDPAFCEKYEDFVRTLVKDVLASVVRLKHERPPSASLQ